jgi:uncharacterized Zn finger protein (UPF0148 family)
MSTAESTVECRVCREINKQGTVACARCGQTLLSGDEMNDRRAQIEQWKREAERESVEYPTMANLLLDRFSDNPQNKGKYFGSISNYRKRIGLLCLFVPVLMVVLWAIATRH